MKLGCIGDDFTGSSDLANTLSKGGMRVDLYNGIPDHKADAGVEAGVVALKTRSVPVEDAVSQTLKALEWLQSQGCEQFFFKYCSTFDSTREGNIGAVLDAMSDYLNATKVVVCPAFPTTGRSIYMGHLFVADQLLSESGMAHHPLTPMKDPDIRRWLSYQTLQSVGHVPYPVVAQGSAAIRVGLDEQSNLGSNLVVVDAILDDDLIEIGKAAKDLKLISGGSGVALGLPANFGCDQCQHSRWKGVSGPGVILSGSCSEATRAQVALYKTDHPALELDVRRLALGNLTAEEIVAWVLQNKELNPLVYSSADPAVVGRLQQEFGDSLAEHLESFFGKVASMLANSGFTRIVSAGGETSGAIITALAPEALKIGPEIDPGVPALLIEDLNLAITLKSGNFGSEDFFEKALDILQDRPNE